MASTKTENKNADVSKTENKAEIVVTEITQEKTNFLRIALLLLEIAKAAVRTKFDAEFSPQRLEKTLQQEKFKTLEPLRRKKVITEKQWELLFPNAGSPCSTVFDSTLMICLLRNLADISVGDKLPVTNDISVAADLSRIKIYRNIVLHSENGSLTDHTFQQYWDDISQAIVRLGGNSFEQRCREMKVTNLDNKTELIMELLNMERPTDPIPVGVKFIQCKTIEEWKAQEKKLVETRAIKHLAELIESEDVVTVIGSSGSGKSTAVHHVALQLIYRGYEIVPVKTPEQMLQYFNPERKQVFVVDDVCGIATIDINKVNSWVEHQLEIEKMLKENKTKILTSCRSYIFQQRHFKSIKAFSITCRLNESNYSLTPTERQDIAQQYLSEQEVQLIINYGLLNKFDFFPLLCKLYSRQSSGDILSFFDNPVKLIRDELTLLKEANDQTTLATLYLFVVYNNRIDENQLSGNSEIKDVLTRISEEFEFSSIFSLRVVKSQLENLTSSFVEKSSYYRIIHDKVFDIMFSFFGDNIIELVIDTCDTHLLRERFEFNLDDYSENETDYFVIKVSETKENCYFNRLFRDMSKGFVETMFLNRQLKSKSFREKLVKYLRTKSDSSKVLNQFSSRLSMILISLLKEGFDELSSFVLTNVDMDLNVTDADGCTALYCAAQNGSTDIVKLLLERKCDPNISIRNIGPPVSLTQMTCGFFICDDNRFKHTPLFIAAEKGYTEIVELLLDYASAEDKIDAMYLSLRFGHTDTAKLLLKNTKNVAQHVYSFCTFRSAMFGKTESVKLLLEYVDVYDIFTSGSGSPLYAALYHDQEDVVELLLERYNKTPYNFALKKGFEEIRTLVSKQIQSNALKRQDSYEHKFGSKRFKRC